MTQNEPQAWTRLFELAARPNQLDIRRRFAQAPDRAVLLTSVLDDFSMDLSKTSIDADVLAALLDLAEASGLDAFRARLFAGETVNVTEGRAAMHMALRAPAGSVMQAAGEDAAGFAQAELARMAPFVEAVQSGALRGVTGERFTDIVNIGIGGSDLGPRMVAEAVTLGRGAVLTPHFLSNVDGHGLQALIRQLDPARTLVLVASKTFTTQETATNAAAARAWIGGALGEAAIARHFVALSTNLAAVASFGITPAQTFGFKDWVGGRFSLWSPVGLSIALAAGWDAFAGLLAGAACMDAHFRTAPFAQNLPVLLGLAGIWHETILGYRAHCVLAYDDRLARFPAFLQQLEMESNGKSVRLDGTPARETAPVVFGEPGTNAQHSFMQLVHQGTSVIPVDFIIAAEPEHDRPEAHRILAAHAFAQSEALLKGRSLAEAQAELLASGMDAKAAAVLAPHRVFTGNRPSVMLLQKKLDAFSLGRLIALYEHKVAVQGAIWGINSFDQWGVELGKVLAGSILPDLQPGAPAGVHDASTTALIARFKALRQET